MSKRNPLTTQCNDWHLGWGFGGYDKIGKLTLDPLTNTFIWKGFSQGRWGANWNRGSYLNFTVKDGIITKLGGKGCHPVQSELLKSVNTILQQQMTK